MEGQNGRARQLVGQVPVSEEMKALALVWSAKKQILDKGVYNSSNGKVGKVEDLIIAPDKAVSYAIVGMGGFLGIDWHDVAIPAGQLKIEGDKLMLPGATAERRDADLIRLRLAGGIRLYAEGQAYVFSYPRACLPKMRWPWVTQPIRAASAPHAPHNQFWHARPLATAAHRDGGSPNNDTMYPMAWLDLTKERVVFSVPDTGDRCR